MAPYREVSYRADCIDCAPGLLPSDPVRVGRPVDPQQVMYTRKRCVGLTLPTTAW